MNITTKQKLIFINLFSLFVIFTFASVIAEDSYQKYNNYKHINQTIKTSLSLSALLHQLQKERGISNSQNKVFTSRLLKEQELTNKTIKKVNAIYLKELEIENSLTFIRTKIEKKSTSSKEIILFYSTLNQKIIDIISNFARTPQDAQIRDLFNSFLFFINAKEKVAIEKALLASVFEANTFNPKQFEQAFFLNSEQKTLLNIFLQTTSPKLESLYLETIQHKSFKEVKQMKAKAFTNYKNMNIDSIYWFDMVSLKIDELKLFEDQIAIQIMNLAEKKSFSSLNEFILVLTITAIIFIYTLLITYSIAKNILNSYKKLEDTLDLIDHNIIVSETDSSGLITYVSKAFCKISGYSKKELLAQPHNIIRHPDMEKETFRDLWKTIKENKTWVGEVKNKKKDGSFYWVTAMVTPKYSSSGEKNGYIAIRQDITDKKIVEELSITDGLTELFNRRHFNAMFPKLINTSRRHNRRICFLMFDVDFFKPYNDTYGHQKGDEALIKIAATIKTTIKRANDLPFRLGGEEFGILFEASSLADAKNLAYTLKTNIQDLNILHEKSPTYKVITVSMGLICKNVDELDTKDTLYKIADDFLYQAKADGRNKLVSNKV